MNKGLLWPISQSRIPYIAFWRALCFAGGLSYLAPTRKMGVCVRDGGRRGFG